MAVTTKANTSALIKERYHAKYFTDALLRSSPLLGLLPKDTGWGGSTTRVPVTAGPGGGVSAKFATAQTNASYGKDYAFSVDTVKLYSLFQIEGEAIRTSRTDPMAFADAVETAMDRSKEGFLRLLGAYAFGDGSGALGRVGSTSTTTLTLTSKWDAVNFWPGMKIVSHDTKTGTTDDNQPIEITAVNPALGTLTAASNWTGSGNFSNNDYLYVEGTKGLVIKGLGAWVPVTAPSASESFFGLDRSVAPYILAGCRYAATSTDSTIVGAIRRAATEHSSFLNAGNIDAIFMHPYDAAQLHDQLGTKTDHYREMKAKAPDMSRALAKAGQLSSYKNIQKEFDAIAAEVGYAAVSIQTGMGQAMVIEDKFCPRRTAFMVNTDSFELGSMGDLLGFLNHEGGTDMQFVYNNDAIEGRLGGYPAMVCRSPSQNCVVDLTNVTSA